MELIPPEEYKTILNYTENNLPDGILVHLWLKLQVEKFAPSTFETFCFIDVWPIPNIICIADKIPEYHGLKNFPVVGLWVNNTYANDQVDFIMKFLHEVDKKLGILNSNSGALFCGIPDYQTHLVEKFIGNDKTKYIKFPNYQFWIPSEKRKQLLETEVKPPDGYYFDVLKLEEAKFVDDTWPHQFPGSLARMEHRIKYLPNVALRVNETGELAAFEVMHDEHGFMNHLYTINGHRRKGLATKVEEKLAQLLIQRNIVPFKYVVASNTGGKAMTDVNPLWEDLGYFGIYMQFFTDKKPNKI